MEAVKLDYLTARLTDADRRMLDFAVKLTLTPARMIEQDVQDLREQGFDDGAIHDIVQITALFNYFDRLADGLGIEPEPEWE